MSTLDSLRFRHDWRGHQARVLGVLDRHLEDGGLHLVAAPGAGKTVLGLEVARRIGHPALVLAPTRTVRDQWRDRLRNDFEGARALSEDALSLDLLRPGLVTFATYQALFAARRRDGAEAVVSAMREAGVATLVLDEAHHLRREWWRALEELCRAIPLRRIALTATPPTDVPQAEWNRYLGLCGPIDEEVSVPELVRAGTLAPHQDLVFLCRPEGEEASELEMHEREVREAFLDLRLDQTLAERLAVHPRLTSEEGAEELPLEARLAAAQLLGEVAGRIPRALLHPLGLDAVARPPLSREGAEALLQDLLFDSREELASDPVLEARLEAWTRRLTRAGAIERRRVHLEGAPRVVRKLERSRSKLAAIARIIEFEHAERRTTLRAAVLVDRVRESDLGAEPRMLGAVPVFETLRRRRLPDLSLALLTGNLVIVPSSVVADLGEGFVGRPLETAPGYARVEGPGGADLVGAVTRALLRGDVHVVIGTAALLGEGWDAPALHTLVLGSSASTAVLSNQMRGRAIRRDPADAEKVANLWHIACVAPGAAGAEELRRLAKRFGSAVSLRRDHEPPRLATDALHFDARALTEPDAIAAHNARTTSWAADRSGAALAWRRAIGGARRVDRPITEVLVSADRLEPPVVLRLRVLSTLRRFWLRRRLGKVARAVVTALTEAGTVEAGATIETMSDARGIGFRIDAASAGSRHALGEALAEVLDPLRDPRWVVLHRKELYGVPARLAGRRREAERFSRAFRRHVGRHRLLFTRRGEGARALRTAQSRAWWERDRHRVESSTAYGMDTS